MPQATKKALRILAAAAVAVTLAAGCGGDSDDGDSQSGAGGSEAVESDGNGGTVAESDGGVTEDDGGSSVGVMADLDVGELCDVLLAGVAASPASAVEFTADTSVSSACQLVGDGPPATRPRINLSADQLADAAQVADVMETNRIYTDAVDISGAVGSGPADEGRYRVAIPAETVVYSLEVSNFDDAREVAVAITEHIING